MSKLSPPLFPRIVTMGCVVTAPSGTCEWHTHAFDELCLIEGGATTIGHAGRTYPAPNGALFLFRAGERHGYFNDRAQRPRLWVMHFMSRVDTYRHVERAAHANPKHRIWKLSARQIQEYLAEFGRISAEHASSSPGSAAAESARIRLMLVNVMRWGQKSGDGVASSSSASAPGSHSGAPDDPELLPLWRLVAESNEPLGELMREFSDRVENYDSLRHRFRRAFGCSPRQMVARVRLSRARSLLVESAMSVKEIAAAVGYGRQHEFARAFRRDTGVSPSDFRRKPVLPHVFR